MATGWVYLPPKVQKKIIDQAIDDAIDPWMIHPTILRLTPPTVNWHFVCKFTHNAAREMTLANTKKTYEAIQALSEGQAFATFQCGFFEYTLRHKARVESSSESLDPIRLPFEVSMRFVYSMEHARMRARVRNVPEHKALLWYPDIHTFAKFEPQPMDIFTSPCHEFWDTLMDMKMEAVDTLEQLFFEGGDSDLARKEFEDANVKPLRMLMDDIRKLEKLYIEHHKREAWEVFIGHFDRMSV